MSVSPGKMLLVTTSDVHSDGRIYRNIQALSQANWEISLVHISNLSDPVPGTKTYRVGFFKSNSNSVFYEILLYLINLFILIMKANYLSVSHRYKVIFVNNMPNILVLSGLIGKLLGGRIILDIHDPFSILFRERFPNGWIFLRPFLWLEEAVSIYLSDALITVNLKMKNLFKKYRKPLLVLHNSPDVHGIKELGASCYETSKTKKKLVFAGHVHKRTGLFELLKELSSFDREILDRIEIEIWGYGPFLKECQRLVEASNLSKLVKFKGKYSHNQIKKIYLDADYSLAPNPPSTFNDFILPVKVLESLSYGVPVLGRKLDIYNYYAKSIDITTYRNFAEFYEIIEKITAKNLSAEKQQVNLSITWATEKNAFIDFVQKEITR